MHKKQLYNHTIFTKLATGFKLTVDKFGGGCYGKKGNCNRFQNIKR